MRVPLYRTAGDMVHSVFIIKRVIRVSYPTAEEKNKISVRIAFSGERAEFSEGVGWTKTPFTPNTKMRSWTGISPSIPSDSHSPQNTVLGQRVWKIPQILKLLELWFLCPGWHCCLWSWDSVIPGAEGAGAPQGCPALHNNSSQRKSSPAPQLL